MRTFEPSSSPPIICIPHQHQMVLINQPKTLVASEGYNMAISINITVTHNVRTSKGKCRQVRWGGSTSSRDRARVSIGGTTLWRPCRFISPLYFLPFEHNTSTVCANTPVASTSSSFDSFTSHKFRARACVCVT